MRAVNQVIEGFPGNYRVVHKGNKRHLVRIDMGTGVDDTNVTIVESFDSESDYNSFMDSFRKSIDDAVEMRIKQETEGGERS